jgi:hypothetical protein
MSGMDSRLGTAESEPVISGLDSWASLGNGKSDTRPGPPRLGFREHCRIGPPPVVERGVAIFDALLGDSLRRIAVGGRGGCGFGPLQGELAALPMCMGGFGIPRGQDIREIAFLSSALNPRSCKRGSETGGRVVFPRLGARPVLGKGGRLW